MTTLLTVIGELRTCATVPWKVRVGYASTVKSTLWPSTTPPMSASATFESICILVRSFAIWKIVGVLKLDATVWPSSTARKITTPSTGETILQ